MLQYKIILAGAKDVGKSSLIARYCDNIFNANTMSTIGVDFKRKSIELENEPDVSVQIWDFGGEERYRVLFPQYVKGAAAALILYDITNKESLADIKNWVKIIKDNIENIMVLILIGTKIDLEDQRVISHEAALKISTKFGCYVDPIETSSKTRENVENAFKAVAHEIVRLKKQKCKSCGEFFDKKLKICNFCGNSA